MVVAGLRREDVRELVRAVLAGEAAGAGAGEGPLSVAGLEVLLEGLFGPRLEEGADWRVGVDWRVGALVWLLGLWLGSGDLAGVAGVAVLREVAGRLVGDVAGPGQDPAGAFGHLYKLVRDAGAGGWLVREGVADVVLAVSAARGDLGVELAGLTVAEPGELPDPASDVAGYLRVLAGGAAEALGAGPGVGGRPGLADLVVVASGLRAVLGLAPGAGLPAGKLAVFAGWWAGEDGGRDEALAPGAPELGVPGSGVPGPGVLAGAARGLRERVAGLLGKAAAQVTAQEVGAVVRAADGYRLEAGRWPVSGEELELPGYAWCPGPARYHWGRNGAVGLLPFMIVDGKLWIMLAERSALVQGGQCFSTVGGAIDGAETPLQAAIREAGEGPGWALRSRASRTGLAARIAAGRTRPSRPRYRATARFRRSPSGPARTPGRRSRCAGFRLRTSRR